MRILVFHVINVDRPLDTKIITYLIVWTKHNVNVLNQHVSSLKQYFYSRVNLCQKVPRIKRVQIMKFIRLFKSMWHEKIISYYYKQIYLFLTKGKNFFSTTNNWENHHVPSTNIWNRQRSEQKWEKGLKKHANGKTRELKFDMRVQLVRTSASSSRREEDDTRFGDIRWLVFRRDQTIQRYC